MSSERKQAFVKELARENREWRERVKAALAAQVEAGGKIYGYRRDGAYVVRTKNGDQITTPGHARS